MAETLTLYKLMVLYMLNKVEGDLTASHISDFMLGKEYTDYFTLQETIMDLENSGLIARRSTANSTLLSITRTGRDTLSYFEYKISEGIKSDVMTFLNENKLDIKKDVSVIADYYKTTEQSYAAQCVLRGEAEPIINLTITCKTKEQAEAICSQWRLKHFEVYEYLMDNLLK